MGIAAEINLRAVECGEPPAGNRADRGPEDKLTPVVHAQPLHYALMRPVDI